MSQPTDSGDSRSPFNPSRRGVLGTLGLGAFTFLGSNTPASALFSRKNDAPKVTVNSSSTNNRGTTAVRAAALDLSALPPEWVARQGGELKVYAAYLTSVRLQRLTPQQVIEAHAKKHGQVWNSLPPRSLWRQMVPTLRVLDRVAMELGQPVDEVVSAYRSPIYNATCSGARRGSWHQANVAVDVKFSASPSTVAGAARSLRSRGLFRGGVGRYGTFTHIDTRGQNVDW
jgi:hypothetical protein